MDPQEPPYRGRLAPSPTGFLHLGHARTFFIAHQRARAAGGTLLLREEDLDPGRSRAEYSEAMLKDLRWIGLDWDEGPDVGGAFGPYVQSARFDTYRRVFDRLRDEGHLYPCYCSRRDIQSALGAPHAGGEDLIYPGTCRPCPGRAIGPRDDATRAPSWRFRVTEGEVVEFEDAIQGWQRFEAGVQFGDFVVWRHDDVPAYQLAVVADDIAMGITEVVRGEDLLLSTARQILLYRALGRTIPQWCHCPLLKDSTGERLAKRHDALSLRELRAEGAEPETLRQGWQDLAK